MVQTTLNSLKYFSTCNSLFFRTSGFYWERLNFELVFMHRSILKP
ncbi:hypothetical protein QWZ13_18175 [Reinekea marina]|nr:hypothetical protein [Reinekea marina]MDN3650838.1 hypothetical protein [Reinekea marina]